MSTDTPKSAVTETRHFEVTCRRGIIESCEVWDEFTSRTHGVRSLSAAEVKFREHGWQLHADGTASCPECLRAWDEGLDLPHEDVKGVDPALDPDEVPDVDEWEAAQRDAAVAADVEAVQQLDGVAQ